MSSVNAANNNANDANTQLKIINIPKEQRTEAAEKQKQEKAAAEAEKQKQEKAAENRRKKKAKIDAFGIAIGLVIAALLCFIGFIVYAHVEGFKGSSGGGKGSSGKGGNVDINISDEAIIGIVAGVGCLIALVAVVGWYNKKSKSGDQSNTPSSPQSSQSSQSSSSSSPA